MHTKTPWELQSRSVSDGALVIKDAEYNEVCCLAEKAQRSYGEVDKARIAIGDHIVRCVNSHVALVEALEECLSAFEIVDEGYYPQAAIDNARIALSKARRSNTARGE